MKALIEKIDKEIADNTVSAGEEDSELYAFFGTILEEIKQLAIEEKDRIIKDIEALPHCCHSDIHQWINKKDTLEIVRGKK